MENHPSLTCLGIDYLMPSQTWQLMTNVWLPIPRYYILTHNGITPRLLLASNYFGLDLLFDGDSSIEN